MRDKNNSYISKYKNIFLKVGMYSAVTCVVFAVITMISLLGILTVYVVKYSFFVSLFSFGMFFLLRFLERKMS